MADYKVIIKKLPECIVYYKDFYANSLTGFLNISNENNFLQDLSDKVMDENPDIALTEPDYNVLVYLDGYFKDNDIHYRFCDAVTGYGKDCEDYKFGKLEGCTALTVKHKGPYRHLGEAYSFAENWMKENGYKQVGLPRDSAIDGCWNRKNEDDYLTEIQIPVEKVFI